MAGTATTDTNLAASTPEPNGTQKSTTRGRRARTEREEEDNGYARYFLGKADNKGVAPALDREVASEGEALVEALRLGVTFYALQEFRVVPDFSGRKPQLNKEPVHGK
jgi:hypothetical protein